MILIGRKNKGNLIDVISVKFFCWKMNEIIDESIGICFRFFFVCPFTHGIPVHCSRSLFQHVIIAVHTRIGFQIESKMSFIAPVYNVLYFFYRKSLVHDYFTTIFNICTITTDHSIIFTEFSLCNFSFGTACT